MMPLKHETCDDPKCKHDAVSHVLGPCRAKGCDCQEFKLPRPKQASKSDVVIEPGVSISNHDPADTKPTMTITGMGTGATRPNVELDSDGRPIGRT